MSNVCEVCGKKPLVGHLVSHSNRKTLRRWMPNLKIVKTTVNGMTKRVKMCTGCIRTATKKATASAKAAVAA